MTLINIFPTIKFVSLNLKYLNNFIIVLNTKTIADIKINYIFHRLNK